MAFVAFLLLFAGIGVLLTWGLSRFRRRWLNYLPGAIALILGLYQWGLAAFAPSEGFEDLGRLLMAWLLLASAIGGLVAAIVIDRVFSKRRT